MENTVNTNYEYVEDNEALVQAFVVSNSSIFSLFLDAAVQLNLFEIIGQADNGALVSPSEIASRLSISSQKVAGPLDCMLRLLASYSLLTCSATKLDTGAIERRYGLAPAGKFYVRDENGASLAKLRDLGFIQPGVMDSYKLKDAILEGGENVFERVYGKSIFEYLSSNPENSKKFADGMTNLSIIIMKRVIETYDGFEGLSSIVNVGGSSGVSLHMIISKYPHIHGVNFDLPEVVQSAPSYKGIHHIGGDMFVKVPPGDAILLQQILHNWSDDKCVQVLRNCYKALPNKGKVIVLEWMLPDIPQADPYSKFASQIDGTMLITCGTRERTKDEFEFMAKTAGFSEFKVVCNVAAMWIMEFIKVE